MGFALLPSNKNLVYEDCLHACVTHVPLPPVQAICSRVQGHCRGETLSRAQATIILASPLCPLPSFPLPASLSLLSSPLPPAPSQLTRLAELPPPQQPHIYKPRGEGQSNREPLQHTTVVAELPGSNLTLSRKSYSVQGSQLTVKTRQVAKSAQPSSSGQAAAAIQGMGSPKGPAYGVEYSVGGPVWGYVSDESIDSLDDAMLEFNREYSECRGGDRYKYTTKECITRVRRL